MIFSFFLVGFGIALLYFGGETLVNNASALARFFGLSPLVIGLTVVAFATSCPELAATITAALRGAPDMALGNAIGSNIANIGLILGFSAMLAPLAASTRFLRREVAFMVLVTVVMYPLLATGRLERWHGVTLLAALVFFLVTLLRDPGSGHVYEDAEDESNDPAPRPAVAGLGVLLGVGLLVAGAQSLVQGASTIALSFGVPERVVGLSLLALGTSLPELATSLIAVRRGQSDLILGNVIGSNIFNLLAILGLTAIVKPIPVAPEALQLDFFVMFGTSVLVVVMLASRQRIVRLEGVILLATYFGYMGYLFAT